MTSSISKKSLTDIESASAAVPESATAAIDHCGSFDVLPKELLDRILSYLNSRELRTLASTSTQMCAMVINFITDITITPDEQQRWQLMSQIAQDCLRAKQIKPAIQITNQITNQKTKEEMVRSIIKAFADRVLLDPLGAREDEDLLLSLSENILDFHGLLGNSLQTVVTAFILWGESEKAIPFAQRILACDTKSMTMRDIVKGLIEENKLDKAYEIARSEEMIPNPWVQSSALRIIEMVYNAQGNREMGDRVAREDFLYSSPLKRHL